MMGRSALVVLALCATASSVAAEDGAEKSRQPERHYPSGTFSHGDSGNFVEDAYGGQVEPRPREDETASRKRDPALRWEGPSGR